MGADLMMANKYRLAAQMAADAKGKSIKLIRSTGIEVVEVMEPKNV